MPRIFISYRRDDTRAMTGRIQDRLELAFGSDNIFKDVDDIPPGADFRQVLHSALAACDVLLVIVGSRWTQVTTAGGTPRLQDPDDFVRFEIATALQRESMTVIPVLVEGASMPTPTDLPDNIRPLAFRNAVVVRHDPDFRRDMDRLIDQLKKIDTSPRPATAGSRAEVGSRVEISSHIEPEDYGLPTRTAAMTSQSKGLTLMVALALGVLIVGVLIGGILFALFSGQGNDTPVLATLSFSQLNSRQATLESQIVIDSNSGDVTFLEAPYGWTSGTTLYAVEDTPLYGDAHNRDSQILVAAIGTEFTVSDAETHLFYDQWNKELWIVVESGGIEGWVRANSLTEG